MISLLATGIGVVVALVSSTVVASQSQFAECVGELQQQARSAGISERTVNEVLAEVQFVERVIELDRQQPEFSQTFSDYFSRRVTSARVEKGRALLVEHRDLLDRVQRRTGVPAHYLVAFWGLETNFGSFFGNMPAADSLATLACDERRSRFFTRELMAALQILDSGDIGVEQMVGSWAGALGLSRSPAQRIVAKG